MLIKNKSYLILEERFPSIVENTHPDNLPYFAPAFPENGEQKQ